MPVLRSTFIALSRNRALRRFCERSSMGQRLSSRFVAGTDIGDALAVAEAMSHQGIGVTLDSLGESVTSTIDAHAAAETYHRVLDWIGTQKINANISVKLTQMGLDVSPNLAESIVQSLADHARATGGFVRVDMEDSRLTQTTLDIVRRLHAHSSLRDAIGVVIQAYLFRSQADVEQLLAEGIRIRLCKGAYNEPPEVAFPRKADVDGNFIRLSRMLLESPLYHGLATHDPAIIEAIRSFVLDRKIDPSHFEFQMLYGIRRDLQRRLAREGYNVRVYVPFGREWYPYFMRRLAERPANALFVAKNLFRS
ncbi:MAG TPA: proline dehydrogenase family protein [Terracidiphilus sp.]|nr:proline dehydrogenase family protein [Terracidiphilus sp.]